MCLNGICSSIYTCIYRDVKLCCMYCVHGYAGMNMSSMSLFLSLYIDTRTYTCIYEYKQAGACMRAYIRTWISKCTHMYICICICVITYTHTSTLVFVYVYMYIYIYIGTYLHVCMYVYIYIETATHVHIHVYVHTHAPSFISIFSGTCRSVQVMSGIRLCGSVQNQGPQDRPQVVGLLS